MSHNLCSKKGCRLAGRVVGFFPLTKSFTLQAENPLAPAPANHLKPFTWIMYSKQKCSPGFWQKVLAYCATKPPEANQARSDTNRNTPFTPGGQKGPHSLVQIYFFSLPVEAAVVIDFAAFITVTPTSPTALPSWVLSALKRSLWLRLLNLSGSFQPPVTNSSLYWLHNGTGITRRRHRITWLA